MRKTLQNIANKLNRENIAWLLAGNTAAVIQGAIIHSNKLTLYSDRVGAYKFGDFFSEYKQERVKFRERPHMSGHIGYFLMNDVDVRIVGEPSVMYQHRPYRIPLEEIYFTIEPSDVGLEKVPLLPLNWLFILGIMAGDTQLASAVAECDLVQQDIHKIAEQLGIGYYIKQEIDAYFRADQ